MKYFWRPNTAPKSGLTLGKIRQLLMGAMVCMPLGAARQAFVRAFRARPIRRFCRIRAALFNSRPSPTDRFWPLGRARAKLSFTRFSNLSLYIFAAVLFCASACSAEVFVIGRILDENGVAIPAVQLTLN